MLSYNFKQNVSEVSSLNQMITMVFKLVVSIKFEEFLRKAHYFELLYNIPLHKYIIIYLSNLLLREILDICRILFFSIMKMLQ